MKTKAEKNKNKCNHYTEKFRREAVRRADDPNTSATDVAKDLVFIQDKYTIGVANTINSVKKKSKV